MSTAEESGDCDQKIYESNLALLQEHLAKPNQEISEIKSLMNATFAGRMKWIIVDVPPVNQIIDLFPPLKKVKYVSRGQRLIASCTNTLCLL